MWVFIFLILLSLFLSILLTTREGFECSTDDEQAQTIMNLQTQVNSMTNLLPQNIAATQTSIDSQTATISNLNKLIALIQNKNSTV